MNTLIRISKVVVIATLILWLGPKLFTARVQPGEIGVRQSAATGVHKEDLSAGMHWRVPGMHKMITLPSGFFFLDYSAEGDGALSIRTRDNNTVVVDVTVPVRIRRGRAHAIVSAGNHVKDGARFRYQRLAAETTISVLREELANLTSVGWYSTDKRLEVSSKALEQLNTALGELGLEAQSVLVRSIEFRAEYERQLTQIQLNEQNKLLDHARQRVADQQQILDNYTQGTAALASAREQDWVKRIAELERAYQIGFVPVSEDASPGAARRKLAAMAPEQVLAMREEAARVFGLDGPGSVTDGYLLGIKNIQAETLEYKNRVNAEADGVSARLAAEGEALESCLMRPPRSRSPGRVRDAAQRAARVAGGPRLRRLQRRPARDVRQDPGVLVPGGHPVGAAAAPVRARLHGRAVARSAVRRGRGARAARGRARARARDRGRGRVRGGRRGSGRGRAATARR